jgi:hypothetical protein
MLERTRRKITGKIKLQAAKSLQTTRSKAMVETQRKIIHLVSTMAKHAICYSNARRD